MTTHDFVAVGLGPFNLGLACLSEPVPDLDGMFLEAREDFSWHPGMLLDDATLQVPFLADLVTLADPTSSYSFLSYLKESGHLYPFYIRESFYPLRREYDAYCRWAADRLGSVRFGREVTSVEHDGTAYVVRTGTGETFRGRRLVLGTGTSPQVPPALRSATDRPRALHSADYLAHREELLGLDSVTVVGSGQSAAEVFADLLGAVGEDCALSWVTRSPRFFSMEYTKLTLELTSPEYSAHFRSLPGDRRAEVLASQQGLYKGISSALVDDIYDRLYARRVAGRGRPPLLVGDTAVTGAAHDGRHVLSLRHRETGEDYELRTAGLVLATGYAAEVPSFLAPVRDRIRWDEQGRFLASASYAVDHAGEEIFVQNAEEHTHGFVAPDLGMGAHRNSTLIAAMTGREVYPVEKRIAFQDFGVPEQLRLLREAG